MILVKKKINKNVISKSVSRMEHVRHGPIRVTAKIATFIMFFLLPTGMYRTFLKDVTWLILVVLFHMGSTIHVLTTRAV